jgi:hypothetical protein
MQLINNIIAMEYLCMHTILLYQIFRCNKVYQYRHQVFFTIIYQTPSNLTGQKMNKAKAKIYKLINGFEEQVYQGCHHDAILLFLLMFCVGNKEVYGNFFLKREVYGNW